MFPTAHKIKCQSVPGFNLQPFLQVVARRRAKVQHGLHQMLALTQASVWQAGEETGHEMLQQPFWCWLGALRARQRFTRVSGLETSPSYCMFLKAN